MNSFNDLATWLNDNQGVVGVGIFILTLTLGWASGIFSALRRRPKFKLRLVDGPTFCCNYETGKTHGAYNVHRTAIALYLRVSNVGSAASGIESISVGYRCNLLPFSRLWIKHAIGRLWLHEQIVAIHDFQVRIGENIKFFPFLTQRSIISGESADTFLIPGKATGGVVYFEQSDSWGGFMPRVIGSKVDLKIIVHDTLGIKHSRRFRVPMVSMQEARAYNPSFGKTLAELRGECLPGDERD